VGFATTYNYDQSTTKFAHSCLALFDGVELCSAEAARRGILFLATLK
jgi:hypothetical protein